MNKDYILSIIKQIDHPQNNDLIQMIENINVSKQTVKIIVNSELTSVVENVTGLWQSLIEKDSKIKSCSVIFTKHSTPNLKKNVSQKNDPFLNKFDLSHLGKIIFVASGKGGVGKSTISNNIATSIAELGFKVGLMDADIYGPSQPKMLGLNKSKIKILDKKIHDIVSKVTEMDEMSIKLGLKSIKWKPIGNKKIDKEMKVYYDEVVNDLLQQLN